MAVKETAIQAAIITYLGILENQGKIWFTRLNNIPPVNKGADGKMMFRRLPRGAKRGIPDILVITKGKTIGLEVKTPTGRQSKEQKDVECHFKRHGQEYYVVRSLEEVENIMNKIEVVR